MRLVEYILILQRFFSFIKKKMADVYSMCAKGVSYKSKQYS